MKKNKSIVLGTNYYIGLSIIRCLGIQNLHVVACDYDFKNSYGAKSKYISEFLEIKGLNKIDQKALNQLIEYAKKQDEKPVLFPSHDKYVEFIDTYYDELEKYFLIPQQKGLNSILMDKWKLYDIALEHGVKVPYSIDISDDNISKKINDTIGYPCIIKPVNTVIFTKLFRKKTFICENEQDIKKYIELCKNNNVEAFVQEIVPGFDDHMLTYDSYIDKSGRTTHYMTAQKQRQWPINFGASVFTKQHYIKEVINIGKPFMEKLNYRGFSEIEFKRHEKTGEIYLIEINVRTTNFNNLIYKTGINMPYIAYCDLTNNKMPDNKYLEHNTNYAFIYGFEDILAIINYKKTAQKSLSSSLKISFSKKWAPAIFDLKDLKPYLHFNGKLIKKILKKIFKTK